jgi:SH3-like domain-containing protein
MRCNSLVLLGALLFALPSTSLRAQTTAATAAAVRAAPDGRLVATMRAGAALKTGAKKSDWTAVTIEGFLHKSVVSAKKNELTIKAPSGAALRASANASGEIVAVVEDGATLERLSTSGEWFRAKRDAWVQTRELKTGAAKKPAAADVASARAPASQRAPQKVAALPPAPAPSAPASASSQAAPARVDGPVVLGDFAASQPLVLRDAPDGKAAGSADSAARVRIIARDHGWARVELEGWVRESELVPVDSSSVSAVSAADLRSDPDHYRGSTVRWVVQAISVQQADPLRKGLAPDEPYLLARGPGSESSLLYLALPAALVPSAKALQPLSTILVLARVREGRSEPSGVPILDVLRIVPR